MDPRFFVRLLASDDKAAGRQRDEEFRAWHRRPDALPLPDDAPSQRRERLAIVKVLARSAALLRAFGRDG